MNRIKKGDEVVVISGKNKGRRGQVTRVLDDEHVLVENLNLVKKHMKPNPSRGVAGGIIEKEAPLHVAKLMLFNPATGKGGRIGYKTLQDGHKVRYFKTNGEVLDAK